MPTPLKKSPAAGPISLVSLRAFASPKLKVDRENRIISGLSVIEDGPALGHDFFVDKKMREQVVASINSKPRGIKSRLTHPGIPDCGGKDGIDTLLGRISNARMDGKNVYGDIKFGKYAAKNPAGDLGDYLMSIAEEDPEICGLSIVFDPDDFEDEDNPDYDPDDEDSQEKYSFGRVKDVSAADFVGDPAANAGGLSARLPALLSRLPQKVLGAIPRTMLDQWIGHFLSQINAPGDVKVPEAITFSGVPTMDHKLLALLVAIGLSANPTVEQAKTFLSGLDAGRKAKLRALCSHSDVPVPAEAVETAAPVAPPAPPVVLSEDEQILAKHSKLAEQLGRLAKVYKLDDKWVETMLAKPGMDMATAAIEAQKALAEKNKPAVVQVGADKVISLGEAMADAIALRSNPNATFYSFKNDTKFQKNWRIERDEHGQPLKRKPHERAHQLSSMRLSEMCRFYLNSLGITEANELAPAQLAELAFDYRKVMGMIGGGDNRLAEGIGDFPGILVDAQNKSLRIAYMEYPSTWEMWARRATAKDFKTINRVQLSGSPDLELVTVGKEYTDGVVKDSNQTYVLQRFGKLLGIYLDTLINDDTDAFSRIPMLMGNACRRKENDVAYAPVTGNQVMKEDNVALFSSAHRNLLSAAAPSVASWTLANTAMRKQFGLAPDSTSKIYLNLEIYAVLCAIEQEFLLRQLLYSGALIPNNTASGATQSQGNMNPAYAPKVKIVADPRLSASSTTAWFPVANPNQIDTVEVCFLEGQPEPVLMQRDGWRIDGRETKVNHVVAAAAIDYRGMVKNPGQ